MIAIQVISCRQANQENLTSAVEINSIEWTIHRIAAFIQVKLNSTLNT